MQVSEPTDPPLEKPPAAPRLPLHFVSKLIVVAVYSVAAIPAGIWCIAGGVHRMRDIPVAANSRVREFDHNEATALFWISAFLLVPAVVMIAAAVWEWRRIRFGPQVVAP